MRTIWGQMTRSPCRPSERGGAGFAFVEGEAQYVGGVVFATVVAVAGAGGGFVEEDEGDFGAAVAAFDGLPYPEAELVFGGSLGG